VIICLHCGKGVCCTAAQLYERCPGAPHHGGLCNDVSVQDTVIDGAWLPLPVCAPAQRVSAEPDSRGHPHTGMAHPTGVHTQQAPRERRLGTLLAVSLSLDQAVKARGVGVLHKQGRW